MNFYTFNLARTYNLYCQNAFKKIYIAYLTDNVCGGSG